MTSSTIAGIAIPDADELYVQSFSFRGRNELRRLCELIANLAAEKYARNELVAVFRNAGWWSAAC
jgi:hypothetical protein